MRGDAHAGERVFGQHRFDGFLPEDLAIDAVDADEMPFEVEQVAVFKSVPGVGGDEDAFAHHDGAGDAFAGEGRGPFEVLGRTPGDGGGGLIRCDA